MLRVFSSLISDLAKRLFLDFATPQECEEYFIKFIEKSEIDAKIDSQQNHIVLATDNTNPYVAVALVVDDVSRTRRPLHFYPNYPTLVRSRPSSVRACTRCIHRHCVFLTSS